MRTPGASNWTTERENALRELWATGMSAAKIARRMGDGLTRNSIIGKAHRLELEPRRSPVDKSKPPMSREQAHQRKLELQRKRRKENGPERRAPRSNVARHSPAKTIPRHRVVYRPESAANDAELVQGWLALNGGARRFERGASGDELAMRDYLRQRGYETAYRQGKLFLKGRGRPRLLTYKDMVALVDDLRAAEGLLRIAA